MLESYNARTKLSDAYDYWSTHMACPNCKTKAGPYTGTIIFFNDGQKITMANLATRIVRFTAEARLQPTATANSKPYSRLTMRCEACPHEYDVFANPGDRRDWTLVGIVDEHRVQEAIGEDTRNIVNDSDGHLRRTLRVSRQWTTEYAVDITHRVSEKSETNWDKLRKVSEKSLETKYSMRKGEKHTLEEEVSIDVPPPRVSMDVTFAWKRIVQAGSVQLTGPHGQIVNLPFRVSIGVTFDQRQSTQHRSTAPDERN